MKRLIKAIGIITPGFLLGVLFVLSCAVDTDTGKVTLQTPTSIAEMMEEMAGFAKDIVFFPDNTFLPAAIDNVQKALEELADNVEDLLNRTSQLENDVASLGNFNVGCPQDMLKVGDSCIEKNKTSNSLSWDVAADTCADKDRRLCYPYELVGFCREVASIDFNNNTWEWSAGVYGDDNVTLALYNSNCTNLSYQGNLTSNTREFRCCSDLQVMVDNGP